MIMRALRDSGSATVTAITTPVSDVNTTTSGYSTNSVSNTPVSDAKTVTQVSAGSNAAQAVSGTGTSIEGRNWLIAGASLGVLFGLYWAFKGNNGKIHLSENSMDVDLGKIVPYFAWATVFGLAAYEATEVIQGVIKAAKE